MKRSGNKNLKIVAATACTIFSLLAVFTGTWAWFTVYRTNSAENSGVTPINPSSKFKKLSFHQCLNTTDSAYQFNKTEYGAIELVSENPTEFRVYGNAFIEMDPFDLLDPSHPVLALIELDKEYTTDAQDNCVRVDADAYYDYFIGELNDDGSPKYYLTDDLNPLSSIVKYASQGFDADGPTQGTYNRYSTYDFTIPNSFDSFVDLTVSDGSVIYNGFEDEKNMFLSNDGSDVQYVGIVFDYYAEAIEYIYSVFLGDEHLEGTMGYACDWVLGI